jgi:RNA polymerase sigma factor (sigma-70 family)
MDETYIQQVLNGDINSFRYLVSKYKDLSFSVARSIIKSDFDAEEVVQDVFINAFRNLHKYERKAKFSTWLYKIVVNESLKRLKRKSLQYVDVDNLGDDEHQPSFEISPIDHLHEEEQKEVINKVLDLLPATESLLLRLYYLEENNVDEIKIITNLSNSNIKVILFRARKHFARTLQKSLKNELNSIL